MRLLVAPPELNMEMDSYRVGSMLELVRKVSLDLAACGLRTRVCVQGSTGEVSMLAQEPSLEALGAVP